MYTSAVPYPSALPTHHHHYHHRINQMNGGINAINGGHRSSAMTSPSNNSSSLIRSSTYSSDYTAPSTRFREAFSVATKRPGYSRPPYVQRSMSMSPTRAGYQDMVPGPPHVGGGGGGRRAPPLSRMMRNSSFDQEQMSSSSHHQHHHPRHLPPPHPGPQPPPVTTSSSSSSNSRPIRSPSTVKERTRDELIDSIVHTRTREHRVMPGFLTASSWEERKAINIDCDKVYPGIFLANGETVQNLDYLKGVGVTHVLNTAERHVPVNPAKYPVHSINYYGFHVDDHPQANISRFFTRTSEFIDEAMRRRGIVVVNCVMGWSRSATIVAAYLISKKGMSASQALETIRAHRPIRPNPGFLQQLAEYENLLRKRLVWQ